jgi:hypothetical protein
MSTMKLGLWIVCVCVWMNSALAKDVTVKILSEGLGTIHVAKVDTATFEKELMAAAKEFKDMDGIILDLHEVDSFWLWSGTMWKTVKPAFDGFDKPFVILMNEDVRADYPLAKWASPRQWTRFEPSGSTEEAEAKLKTLVSREKRDAQARMEWMMQNEKKQ